MKRRLWSKTKAPPGFPMPVKRRLVVKGPQPPGYPPWRHGQRGEHVLWQTGEYRWCMACGAHCSQRAVKVAGDCLGAPASVAARHRRNRLARGCHPLMASMWLGEPRQLEAVEAAVLLQAIRA